MGEKAKVVGESSSNKGEKIYILEMEELVEKLNLK